MTPQPALLAAAYSTASAEAVAGFIEAQYALGSVPECRLLSRGINDSYAVRLPSGERYVLRLSGHRPRGDADVASEAAFLAYLDGAGVPVAAAVPRRDGTLSGSAPLPDGPRGAVLFHDAGGRKPELDAPPDAWRQGRTLARLHDAADAYPGRAAGRYRLDLDHLLHRPLAAVLALGLDAPAAADEIRALAERLATAVGAIAGDLVHTRLHGDCHGLNARIATDGRQRDEAVFFDFDDSGFGPLAYDLAVHLWAQVSFGRRRQAMWHAFGAGYRAVRPISPLDAEAVHLFVPIRHIWLMGEYAARIAEWGSEILSAEWLAREVAFMMAWERDRMAPGLLRG